MNFKKVLDKIRIIAIFNMAVGTLTGRYLLGKPRLQKCNFHLKYSICVEFTRFKSDTNIRGNKDVLLFVKKIGLKIVGLSPTRAIQTPFMGKKLVVMPSSVFYPLSILL